MAKRARKRRSRRLRRVTRAVLKHGPAARPQHRSPSGRTGSVATAQRKEAATKSRAPTPPTDEEA